MYSIGKLCKEFEISRSTLLYYDNIDLLKASGRTSANYRQYTEEDRNRLSQICTFREAGIPLVQIKAILDNEETNEDNVLEMRLNELNQEIYYLRIQQRIIVEMLKRKNLTGKKMPLEKQTFLSILTAAGLDEEQIDNFHAVFEKKSPESHQLFLELLGLSDGEIQEIRGFSRLMGDKA